MTNLQVAQKFFSDTFGAICFYNDVKDGYTEFEDGRTKIETLSVYFPNRLDLYDVEVKNRLTQVAGDKFYERYSGAENKIVCGMQANKLLVAFYLDGKVIGIVNYIPIGLKGHCDLIFDYFSGVDLDRYADEVVTFSVSVPTNNGLKMSKGLRIKTAIEQYLSDNNIMPLRKKFGYYVLPERSGEYPVEVRQEAFRDINKYFKNENARFTEIAERRKENHTELFKFLSAEDWSTFYKDMGVNPPRPTRED